MPGSLEIDPVGHDMQNVAVEAPAMAKRSKSQCKYHVGMKEGIKKIILNMQHDHMRDLMTLKDLRKVYEIGYQRTQIT